MPTGPTGMAHSFPKKSPSSPQGPTLSSLSENGNKKTEIVLWHHFLALLPRGRVCPLQSWSLIADTIFRCPQGKSFPPLPLDLSELGGQRKWKSPKKGWMIWFRQHKRGRRRMEKFETYAMYLFLYLTHIHVQCQTQFSMHPQMHIPVIHLRPWGLERQSKSASTHFIQFKCCSTMKGKTLDSFCCPRVKDVTPR